MLNHFRFGTLFQLHVMTIVNRVHTRLLTAGDMQQIDRTRSGFTACQTQGRHLFSQTLCQMQEDFRLNRSRQRTALGGHAVLNLKQFAVATAEGWLELTVNIDQTDRIQRQRQCINLFSAQSLRRVRQYKLL